MHWGDLGQQVTGIPVVHLTDGHRAAVPPWCSGCTSLPPVLVRASKYLETCPRPSGRPGDTTTGHLLGHAGVFQGGWGFLGIWPDRGGDYRRLVRGATANKLQYSALLWPSCAKSGILYLHGGQREPGIPVPHEPGHIRERLKEVRATHARAKKSRPLTPPCPNHPRWRCGVLPKQGARGSRCPRRCRRQARGQGRTGRTQRRRQLETRWAGGPRQDTVPFLSCREEQKLRFQGQEHSAALRVPVRLGGKS